MKQNDLAKEYLNKVSGSALYFQENDIKAAFNAGRESVVENMSELKWVETTYNLEDYFLSHNNGWNYGIFFRGGVFRVHVNSNYIRQYLSLAEAKLAANEDYKKRIKQALGL